MKRRPHYEQVQVAYKTDFSYAAPPGHFMVKVAKLTNKFQDNPVIFRAAGYVYEVSASIAAWMTAFVSEGCPIYKIARDFGKQLNRVDLKLSGKTIPSDEKIMCIEFPDDMRFKTKDGYAHCVYVIAFDPNMPSMEGILDGKKAVK